MGIRLIVEVLDHAPEELTPRERLLLVALAEKASDDTRTCWPGMETLTRRTGLSPSSVRAILAQLAEHGYEIRVPSGTDKNGKQVFAHHRHRTEYRLPRFPPRRQDPSTIKAPGSERLDGGKAPGSGTGRRQDPSGKAPGSWRPFPQEPSREPSNHPRATEDEIAAVVEALRDRTGKTVDEHQAELVADQLLDRPGIRDPAKYLIGAIAKDPDVRRFLPTPTPPPFRREDYQ